MVSKAEDGPREAERRRNEQVLTPYRRAVLAQTEAWVNGFSYHSQDTDECCPDFSCCRPEMFQEDQSKRAAELQRLQIRYGLVQ